LTFFCGAVPGAAGVCRCALDSAACKLVPSPFVVAEPSAPAMKAASFQPDLDQGRHLQKPRGNRADGDLCRQRRYRPGFPFRPLGPVEYGWWLKHREWAIQRMRADNVASSGER